MELEGGSGVGTGCEICDKTTDELYHSHGYEFICFDCLTTLEEGDD